VTKECIPHYIFPTFGSVAFQIVDCRGSGHQHNIKSRKEEIVEFGKTFQHSFVLVILNNNSSKCGEDFVHLQLG
jgi:hypothetical protein